MTDGCSVTYSTTSADTLVHSGHRFEGCPKVTAPGGFTLIPVGLALSFGITDAVRLPSLLAPQTTSLRATGSSLPANLRSGSSMRSQACVGSVLRQNTAVLQPISIDMSQFRAECNVTVTGATRVPRPSPPTARPQSISGASVLARFTLSFSKRGNVRNGFP